jgi:very-short-patch-repair endonuclease
MPGERKASAAVARALRRRAPAAERRLRAILRGRGLADSKFRRQAPIGPYIADFVCYRHRLIVEADGPFHDEGDMVRDAWLSAQGYRLLRFANAVILTDRNAVIAAILQATNRTL